VSTGPPQPTGAVAPPPSPSGDVTNPISDDSPVEPSTGQPLPNPGGGDYTGMMQQAKNAWNSSNFQMVQHILTRAIQTQLDNPRAYSGLGELYLYAYNNSGLAMQNFQAAIARGGEAVFHVMHDHSAGTFVTHCRGYLRISANGVRYQPVPASVSRVCRVQGANPRGPEQTRYSISVSGADRVRASTSIRFTSG